MKTLKIKDIEEIVKSKDETVAVEVSGANIKVKQRLSIVDKLNLVESCLLSGLNDTTGAINRNSVEIAKVIFITKFYTDIKTSKDNIKMYDLLIDSGVYDEIVKAIPDKEIESIELLLKNQLEDHYEETIRDNSLEKIVKKGIEDIKMIILNMVNELPDEKGMEDMVKKIRDTLDGADPDNLKIIDGLINNANKDSED